MGYRRRIYFTEKQKAEIWDRWQRGESMRSIGRLFDRGSSSIYPLLARTGGIRPPERKRSRLALTLAEREEISRGLRARQSLRAIARQLRRAPSTIGREVGRNGGRRLYRATLSDQAAWDRARRPKPCKLANRPWLCQTILVERFHDTNAAQAAKEEFIARFREGAMPEDMPEKTLDTDGEGIGIAAALSGCGLTSSNSEAFRMIQQGGVRIDGEKVSDRGLVLSAGFSGILQVGKRKFCKADVR